MIKLPIEIGDILLVGRFKNKRIKVKEIGTDEHGLPTVNGRGILKIRIEKFMKTKKNLKESFKRVISVYKIKTPIWVDIENMTGNKNIDELELKKGQLVSVVEYDDENSMAFLKIDNKIYTTYDLLDAAEYVKGKKLKYIEENMKKNLKEAYNLAPTTGGNGKSNYKPIKKGQKFKVMNYDDSSDSGQPVVVTALNDSFKSQDEEFAYEVGIQFQNGQKGWAYYVPESNVWEVGEGDYLGESKQLKESKQFSLAQTAKKILKESEYKSELDKQFKNEHGDLCIIKRNVIKSDNSGPYATTAKSIDEYDVVSLSEKKYDKNYILNWAREIWKSSSMVDRKVDKVMAFEDMWTVTVTTTVWQN